MPLIVTAGAKVFVADEARPSTIGRDENVDFVLENRRISRHHLALEFRDDNWYARDLGSSNGTFLDGALVREIPIQDQTQLVLGGDEGVTVRFEIVKSDRKTIQPVVDSEITEPLVNGSIDRSEADRTAEVQKRRSQIGERLRIGRLSSNDLVLSNPEIADQHAEIVINRNKEFEIVDLGTRSGTFVNGVRVKRQTLHLGDSVAIGPEVYVFTGSALETQDSLRGLSLVAREISYEVAGKLLLNDVSFELKPNSVTALIGPSGAGKSTLLAALTGKLAINAGSVSFGGRDLLRDFDQLKSKIGFVPQSDLLHTTLTVRQALEYGASLRFPKGTPKSVRDARIDSVLRELSLTERQSLRIDKLSGGQRKRASVALELLTEPLLLFLDEPTSGLDPGLDRAVMQLLRELADGGKTVVVVTHSTANLDLTDDVVIMAPGGNLAYFGSPSAVMKTFDARDWSEVFDALQVRQFDSTSSRRTSESVYKTDKGQRGLLSASPLQSWFTQFSVLAKRHLAVIAADKAYLGLLIIMPILLSLIGLLTGSEFGLGKGDASRGDLNPEARSILLVLILGNAFMGAASSVQEIVKERVIFLRERAVGLRASSYVFSKIWVLGIIVILQSALFGLVALTGRHIPEKALVLFDVLAELLVPMVLLALASMLIGLVVSSLVKSTDVTMPLLVVITMVLVIFSGAVPLANEEVLDFVGPLMPSYWAMNAISKTTELNALTYSDTQDYVSAWSNYDANWIIDIGFLGAGTVVLMVALRLTMSAKLNRR